MAWEAIALPLGDARVCLSILTQLAQRGECGHNSFRTSRKATRMAVGEKGMGPRLAGISLPCTQFQPVAVPLTCKKVTARRVRAICRRRLLRFPSTKATHRKVNHMVERAPRQNTEVTKAKEPTRHGLANRPGRCQLRGGDPIRGGVPLAAGHAGLLGGDRRAL